MARASLVIPAFNASQALKKNLPYLISHLNESGDQWEVIVVDDGSSDDGATKSYVESIGLIYEGLAKNMGKGGALKKGFAGATGEYIIFTDADIPYRAEEILNMLEVLKSDQPDVVIGNRLLRGSDYYKKISFFRRIGSRAFAALTKIMGLNPFQDTQCGLKGFQKRLGKELFAASEIVGFAIDVEILYRAKARDCQVVSVPVTLRSIDGKSIHLVRQSLEMARDLIQFRFSLFQMNLLGRRRRIRLGR